MPWDVPLFSSVALLVLLQGPKIDGVSQESGYVIECIRDMIPNQIFNECCVRENNCTLTRQQNKGIDCMSRMIMANFSSAFSNSHNAGSGTTESSHQYNGNSHRWYGDVLETLAEICGRQQKGRQNCIRNELIKRCRYSMLQDRITSPPGRWNQNGGYHDNDQFGDRNDRRRYQPRQFYGNSRNQDSSNYNTRHDYGDPQLSPRSNYNEESDEEDFGFSSHGDSMIYKY